MWSTFEMDSTGTANGSSLGCGVTLPAGASEADIAAAVRHALTDESLGQRAAEHAGELLTDIDRNLAVTELLSSGRVATGTMSTSQEWDH